MPDKPIRMHFGDYLGKGEVVIYSLLALLLFATALLTIANVVTMLWQAVAHWSVAAQTLLVLDQLLVVLMLVEILHTVRISIRSHVLVTEPFLIVGLIASIRRMLVITLEAATLTKGGNWSGERCQYISRAHDGVGTARVAHFDPGFLHHTVAPRRPHPAGPRELTSAVARG